MVKPEGSGKIIISVACAAGYYGDPLRAAINQWVKVLHDEDRSYARKVGLPVMEQNLEAAVDVARKNIDKTILVTIGYHNGEVTARLDFPEASRMEVVVCKSGAGGVRQSRPSASPLDPSLVEAKNEPEKFLHKAILRLLARDLITVHPLSTREEVKTYFALRYRVWKEMNYLSADRDCTSSQLEVNNTDRYSYPIGVFSADEPTKILGCARLVRDGSHENLRLLPLITQLVEERRDACLKANFALPQAASHPYDLLESFDEFKHYFHDLVTQGTSRAEVSRVIVDTANRASGLGEIIVDSLIHEAQRRGIVRLFLACLKKHAPFYGRSGFVLIPGLNECASFAGVDVPAVAMHIERI